MTAKPDFPRRMLSFNKSGATNFSVFVLFSFPSAFLNSGSVLEFPSIGVWRDFRFARKSNFPGAVGAAFWASDKLFVGGEIEGSGDGNFGIRGISKAFLTMLSGFAASPGGGDLAFTNGGGDLAFAIGGGDLDFGMGDGVWNDLLTGES